jgi:hypothetical protein
MIGEAWPGSGGGGATGGVGCAIAMEAANSEQLMKSDSWRIETPVGLEFRRTLAGGCGDDNGVTPPFVELTAGERKG